MWYLIVSIPDLCTLTYFKSNYRLMQVKSNAECSNWSIMQNCRPSLSYHLPLRSFIFSLFLSGRLRHVFAVTETPIHVLAAASCMHMRICIHVGTCTPLSVVDALFSIAPIVCLLCSTKCPRDKRCFYPCEIILFHIPVPARGKIKNEQPHVGRTLAACRSLTSL